jgi:hypothetical protein
MDVLSSFLCEAQQPFSWSLPQQSPQAAAALSLSPFMQDFASLPWQQAEAFSPEQHDMAFSSFPAISWRQQDCPSLALAIFSQHAAQSVLACGAAFSCGAGAGGFWVAVWAQDATVRARISAVNLNFTIISLMYVSDE